MASFCIQEVAQGYPEFPLSQNTESAHIRKMKMVPKHIIAVFQLLSKLGGLDVVTIYGLRETLQ
jgi:hypothetical protein